MPPKAQCGNPLWLSWMEELRDAAREKGIKSAESYGKACRSLAACPITYTRPRELTALVGIGDKTAQMLEVRWAAYCKENGMPLPGEISPAKKGKGKAKSSNKGGRTPDADGILHSSDSDEDAEEPVGKKRKPAVKKPPKQYIPQRGSGGYGIVLALVLAIDRPETTTTVYLTKSEIIRAAKEYCDSSYEHSEKGTYFTAWSGMKTMVNKGLVYMTGNPHKFCLTEEGYEVAVALRKLRPELAHLEQHPFKHDEIEDSTPKAIESAPEPTRAPKPAPRTSNESQAGPSRPNKFHFWYIDSSGNRVEELSAAMIRLDHDEFINLRKIEFLASQKSHPFATQLRLVDKTPQLREDGEPSLFGYVVEEGAPPTCSKFPSRNNDDLGLSPIRSVAVPESGQTLKRPREIMPPSSDGFDGIDDLEEPASKTRSVIAKSTFARTASVPSGPTTSAKLAADAAMRRLGGGDPLSRTTSGTDLLTKARAGPRLSSHIPAANPLKEIDEAPSESANIPDFDPRQSIVFPAGSYDVVLVLDTREIESKSTRDNFSEAIQAKGINIETRALRLGDVLWVAKRRDGLGGEEDECVLDYVVERKRLDDLCSSIKDGRYTEQCFRLTNSCINHVYYIVEDWDVTNRMQYDGKQIMTAKSQIQIHNRFFLKETTKLSQTIDFLVTMTKVIQSTLASQDLHIIPTRYLSRSTYSALQVHLQRVYGDRTFLTSFEAYQGLNDKNASRTLKVAFGRMLMSVKGMSAERVSAMLDIWETPRDIWEALKIRNQEGEKPVDLIVKGKKGKARGPDLFFADMIQGDGRRKIGDALSKELYRVFMGSAVGSQA